MKMHLKPPSAKWRPLCPGEDQSTDNILDIILNFYHRAAYYHHAHSYFIYNFARRLPMISNVALTVIIDMLHTALSITSVSFGINRLRLA